MGTGIGPAGGSTSAATVQHVASANRAPTAASGSQSPLGRLGKIGEVVDGVLCLELATFVTGETLTQGSGIGQLNDYAHAEREKRHKRPVSCRPSANVNRQT
jgi:NAD(P)-dependent dehydrogenase (short-subunit alcohol dehydrogenase family)